MLSLLLGGSLLAVPYLPTNDGPEHVLATHIEAHYGDPGSIYADTLVPTTEYAAHGFSLLFGPLSDVLGWQRGLQVALVVIVLASAWGFALLVRAVDPGRLGIAFLGFPLALSWELYMGFFPFAVGSALGLFVLALVLRWPEPTRGKRIVLAFLLLLQAVCHVFTAVLTGVVLLVVMVARSPRGARFRELAKVALMGAPAALVLVASVALGGSLTKTPFSEAFVPLPFRVTLGVLPRIVSPGPWWRALVVTALTVAAVGIAGAKLASRRARSEDGALLGAGVALILLSILCPLHVPGWQFFSPRFVALAVLLSLAAVPLEQLAPRHRRWISVSLFALSAASLLVSRGLHRRLAASSRDALAGLSSGVKREAFWLPVTLAPEGALPFDPTESEVPFLSPLRHLPSLYAVALGGLTPYTFANNAATYPFVVRQGGRKPPPIPAAETYAPEIESDRFDRDAAFRRRVEDELATYGMFYEGVLVTGARPADLDLWRARGYATDWANDSVLIGRFVPCSLDVSVPTGGAIPRLDVGVGGQTIFRDESPSPTIDGEGVSHLTLARAPCGDVWVRPHWDATRQDGTAVRAFCNNADATGAIASTLTRTSGAVRCELPR